jgi:disulfide bond formation protein DsbB
MTIPRLSMAMLLATLTAASALLVALGSEWWGGLVPCALCLLERWPYRVAIIVGLLGLVMPARFRRLFLLLLALCGIASAVLTFVHVGVEARWWPSPLPECAAPHFFGGSIAERLASMPAKPSKSCEDPTYLVPGVPLSMAVMNLIFALAFTLGIAMFLWRTRRSER